MEEILKGIVAMVAGAALLFLVVSGLFSSILSSRISHKEEELERLRQQEKKEEEQ